MPSGGIPRVPIHPAEQFGKAYQYIQGINMPSGSEISTATVAARNRETGLDSSSGVLQSTTGTVSSLVGGIQTVTAALQGGGAAFDDTEHVVEITSTLDSGEVFVDVFILVVSNRVEE